MYKNTLFKVFQTICEYRYMCSERQLNVQGKNKRM